MTKKEKNNILDKQTKKYLENNQVFLFKDFLEKIDVKSEQEWNNFKIAINVFELYWYDDMKFDYVFRNDLKKDQDTFMRLWDRYEAQYNSYLIDESANEIVFSTSKSQQRLFEKYLENNPSKERSYNNYLEFIKNNEFSLNELYEKYEPSIEKVISLFDKYKYDAYQIVFNENVWNDMIRQIDYSKKDDDFYIDFYEETTYNSTKEVLEVFRNTKPTFKK